MNFFGINFSLLQVTAVAVAIISSIVVYAIFQYTEVGLKMRAGSVMINNLQQYLASMSIK